MDGWGIKIVFAVGLTALTLLLTGPGMWSERWGWGFLKKAERRPREPDPRR